MSDIKIIYNGEDCFGNFPEPLVAINEVPIYYSEIWNKEIQINLNGLITGCSFDKIYSGYDFIKSKFKRNYQSLEIWQIDGANSGLVFQSDYVKLNSFSVPDQRWVGLLNYEISLSSYPQNYFSGQYGVLDPTEEWNYTEENDRTFKAIHTLQCRGINTSSNTNNALNNAKNWVLNKKNTDSFITPIFINNTNVNNLCLLEEQEQIDRLNGTYGVVSTYISDLTRNDEGILRYSVDLSKNNDLITVSVNGNVKGCNQNITGARTIFSRFSPFAAASFIYNKIEFTNNLNSIPLNFSINEDPLESNISFSYTYDNDQSPEIYYDYTVSLNSGDNITAGINGTIFVRGGTIDNKLTRAEKYAQTLNLYDLTNNFYKEFYPNNNAKPLNITPVSKTNAKNESDGTIALGAIFDNSTQFSNFEKFDYTVSYTPSIKKIDAQGTVRKDFIEPYYSVVDLKYGNRAIVEINGNFVGKSSISAENVLTSIKSTAQKIVENYLRRGGSSVILEKNEINFTKNNNKEGSFSFAWSFKAAISNPNIGTVNSFGVS